MRPKNAVVRLQCGENPTGEVQAERLKLANSTPAVPFLLEVVLRGQNTSVQVILAFLW
jgi:hypothetical protein